MIALIYKGVKKSKSVTLDLKIFNVCIAEPDKTIYLILLSCGKIKI